MKGILNYSEYSCPCGGDVNRHKVSTVTTGLFRKKTIFTYYYECPFCGKRSENYEADITDRCG